MERSLREQLQKAWIPSLKGILMAEELFWLLESDGGSIYLFNRRFQRTHVKRISADAGSVSAEGLEDPFDTTSAGKGGKFVVAGGKSGITGGKFGVTDGKSGVTDGKPGVTDGKPGVAGGKSGVAGRKSSVTGGMAERGLGILLGSEAFYENVPVELMKQCLASQEITREGQIRNRLQELFCAGGRKGCAVYIRTV